MTLPLALTVPLMADEPPHYFAARLAARNFCTARQFAADMNFSFMDVVRGSDEQFCKLAELGGISAAILRGSAVRLTKERGTFREQVLDPKLLRRSRVVICPRCLEDDINESELPPSVAIYGRAHWMFSSIRTCPVHSLALVPVGECMSTDNRHDWSQIVSPFVNRLPHLIEVASHRPASDFETYLLDRLYGRTNKCWLDNLDFFAAEYFTELVGSVATFGRNVNLRLLTDEERYAAGVAGFPIVKEGAKGIVAFLSQLEREYVNDGRMCGPSSVYGKLYSRLTNGLNLLPYAPVHAIMTEHILSKFPIGPGDVLFGAPVAIRRLHSIQTASKFYGVCHRTLRKALEADGLVPNLAAKGRDVLIDASDVERIVLRDKESLTLLQAQEYLNVSATSMNVLLKAGFVKRHLIRSGKSGYRYFESELDHFLTTLSVDAAPVERTTANVMQLRTVARHASRSLADIIQLILDRKVKWVGRLPKIRGIKALVLKLDEVKTLVRGPTVDGLPAVRAHRLLGISARILRQIARRGLIKTVRGVDPVNRCPRLLFPLDELERFQAKYISFYLLKEGRSAKTLRKELAAQGIKPAEELSELDATFYKRSDLNL